MNGRKSGDASRADITRFERLELKIKEMFNQQIFKWEGILKSYVDKQETTT